MAPNVGCIHSHTGRTKLSFKSLSTNKWALERLSTVEDTEMDFHTSDHQYYDDFYHTILKSKSIGVGSRQRKESKVHGKSFGELLPFIEEPRTFSYSL